MAAERVVERALADVGAGDLGKARRRLQSYIHASGFDGAVCLQIARISLEMKDPREAGRWYFLVSSTDADAECCVAEFIRASGGTQEQVRASLPRGLTTATPSRLPAAAAERLGALPNANRVRKAAAPEKADAGVTLIVLGCGALAVVVLGLAAFGLYALVKAVAK